MSAELAPVFESTGWDERWDGPGLLASGGADLSYWDLHGFLLLLPTAFLLIAGRPTPARSRNATQAERSAVGWSRAMCGSASETSRRELSPLPVLSVSSADLCAWGAMMPDFDSPQPPSRREDGVNRSLTPPWVPSSTGGVGARRSLPAAHALSAAREQASAPRTRDGGPGDAQRPLLRVAVPSGGSTGAGGSPEVAEPSTSALVEAAMEAGLQTAASLVRLCAQPRGQLAALCVMNVLSATSLLLTQPSWPSLVWAVLCLAATAAVFGRPYVDANGAEHHVTFADESWGLLWRRRVGASDEIAARSKQILRFGRATLQRTLSGVGLAAAADVAAPVSGAGGVARRQTPPGGAAGGISRRQTPPGGEPTSPGRRHTPPAGASPVLEALQQHELAEVERGPLSVDPAEAEGCLCTVLAEAEEHRWLDAGLGLKALDACVRLNPAHPGVEAMQRGLRAQPERARALQTVRSRYRECVGTLRVLSNPDGWTFASEVKGAETHYRHDTAGRLWLKTEGVMEDVSCIECLAMWKEIDLFSLWFPLCSNARTLAQQGRVELLAWMDISAGALPIGRRDAVLHGYGVDALKDGFMMIVGRSAQQHDFPTIPFPPLRGLGAARMDIQGLQVLIQPLSERAVRCSYVCHIDLRAPLPAPMVNFATQRVVGMIFHKLRKEAKRIRHGAQVSEHAARMQRESDTYFGWMQPRVLSALEAKEAA